MSVISFSVAQEIVNMGTINIKVNEEKIVEEYATSAGMWSHEGEYFIRTARSYSNSRISCTIVGKKVGTANEVNPESWTQLKGSNEKGI